MIRMNKKYYFILFLFFLFYPLSSEPFTKADLFFAFGDYHVLAFPTEEELFLLFQKNRLPLKNTKIFFYDSNGKAASAVTDKEGSIFRENMAEDLLRFRVDGTNAIYTLPVKKIEKPSVLLFLDKKRDGKAREIVGRFLGEWKNKEVTFVYQKNGTTIYSQKVKLDSSGKFIAPIVPNNPFMTLSIFYGDNLLDTYVMGWDFKNELPVLFQPQFLSISGFEFLLPDRRVRITGKRDLEMVVSSFLQEGVNTQTVYFPNKDGTLLFDGPEAPERIRGELEFVYKNGKSEKQTLSVPLLSAEMEDQKYRYYETQSDKNKVVFFSDNSYRDCFVVFYNKRIRKVKAVEIVKGVNEIEFGEAETGESFSAAIICPDRITGRNYGLIIRVVRENERDYGDLTSKNRGMQLLIQERNPERGREGDFKFSCYIPSVTDGLDVVPSEVTLWNRSRKRKKIFLRVLNSNNEFYDLVEEPVSLDAGCQEEISLQIPFFQEKGGTKGLLIMEEILSQEYLIGYVPPQPVEKTVAYYDTVSMLGKIIEDREVKNTIVLPSEEIEMEIDGYFSTDTRASAFQNSYATSITSKTVFEEALLVYLQDRVLTGKEPKKWGKNLYFYPMFLTRFLTKNGLIRRFSNERGGKMPDVDSSLLYLFAASKFPELRIQNLESRVYQYLINESEKWSGNWFRRNLFSFITEGKGEKVLENQKVAEFHGVKIENTVFNSDFLLSGESSTVAKIMAILLPQTDKIEQMQTTEYILENSFLPKSVNRGVLRNGETAGTKISLSSYFMTLTKQREIEFKIKKRGELPLIYQMNGKFYTNDITSISNRLQATLMDEYGNEWLHGNLEKNSKYVIRVSLPEELTYRDVCLILKGQIVSAIDTFRLEIEGESFQMDSDQCVYLNGKNFTLTFVPNFSFPVEELRFLVFPLVTNAASSMHAYFTFQEKDF